MKLFCLGALFSTIGITLLTSFSEVLDAFAELIKANINEKIMRHNVVISKLNNEEAERPNAIGFITEVGGEDE